MALAGVLKFGSKGENVKLVQQELNITVDGIFGKQTENAVKAFQKSKGLTVDGVVGPLTWEALGLNKEDSTVSNAKLSDPEKTKITVTYSTNSYGFPTIGSTAVKTINGNSQVFSNSDYVISFDDPTFIEGVTSRAFFDLASTISAAVSPTTIYTIQNFVFIPPVGLVVPDPTDSFESLEQERAQQNESANRLEAQADQLKVEPQPILDATPESNKPKGSEKLPFIINKYGAQILSLIIPPLLELINQVQFEDVCPPEATLLVLIERRNRIAARLNSIGNLIDKAGNSISGISNFLNITIAALKTIDIVSIATSLAVKIIPSPPGTPGVITSTLNDLQTAIRKLTFDSQGNSRLNKSLGTINASALALSIIGGYVLKASLLLKTLDAQFKKCLPNATYVELSPEIQAIAEAQLQAEQTLNQTTYQGFIIEIEEIPYTPTVTRRRAIGKNSSGIVLIQTELSFTSDPVTLINELKFIIDRDNLKAY